MVYVLYFGEEDSRRGVAMKLLDWMVCFQMIPRCDVAGSERGDIGRGGHVRGGACHGLDM